PGQTPENAIVVPGATALTAAASDWPELQLTVMAASALAGKAIIARAQTPSAARIDCMSIPSRFGAALVHPPQNYNTQGAGINLSATTPTSMCGGRGSYSG